MKSKFLMLMTLSLAASSAAAADPGITTGNMLKLRRAPAFEAVAIEAYPRGETVEIIGRSPNGKWYKVRVPSDGKTGFMFAKYIGRKKVTDEQQTGTTKNESQGMSRTEPVVLQEACGQNEDGKVMALISSGADAALQEKYDNAVKELNSVKVEIKSLKETVAGLRNDLIQKDKEIGLLKEKVALYDGIGDIRLMSNVEALGVDVLFTGIGLVKFYQEGDRVILRIPNEHTVVAKKVFSRVEKHIFGGENHLYVTIDKKILNIV